MATEEKGKERQGAPGPVQGARRDLSSLVDDDLVTQLVRDPGHPPDLVLLSGFVGPSSEGDHVRLYLDFLFSTFLDIPRDIIVHRQKIPEAQSPLGGSYVWIAREGWPRCRYGNVRMPHWQQQQAGPGGQWPGGQGPGGPWGAPR